VTSLPGFTATIEATPTKYAFYCNFYDSMSGEKYQCSCSDQSCSCTINKIDKKSGKITYTYPYSNYDLNEIKHWAKGAGASCP
jgi:hypothetical protein